MILAGDIGGTKTVLALFEETSDGLREVRDETFASKDYKSLVDILAKFVPQPLPSSLRVACFGVAGPVVDGRCQTTNLPWILEEPALAQASGAARVKLLNDLEAAAYGMLFLRPDELCVLNAGSQRRCQGNIAVIAAGTGLGEALLYWDGKQHHPIASEGGHTDFAPRTDQEIDLLRYLRAKLGGRVSYERVLSGPGLSHIYGFLRDSGYAGEPNWLVEKLRSDDPNVVITQCGLAGEHPLCVAALEMFCSLYGAEAGNLALKGLAIGGVFIGGGIAREILPALQQGGFMRSFTDKGRFTELLQGIQVTVALNPRAPLLGAAHFALR
jgi:glucokinase